MLDIKDYAGAPLFDLIRDLDEKMKEKDLPAIELNVVGGFALMVHDIRNINDYTDVDYAGSSVPDDVKNLADSLGEKTEIGKNWLNNDLMLSGTTLEDLEFATGKLNFLPTFQLEKIRVNVLAAEDLLRMKLISVDTSLTAVELGGDFTREKDFKDISMLMKRLELSAKDLEKNYAQYLIGEDTLDAVIAYNSKENDLEGKKAVIMLVKRKQFERLKREFEPEDKPYERSALVDDMLNSAIARSRDEL